MTAHKSTPLSSSRRFSKGDRVGDLTIVGYHRPGDNPVYRAMCSCGNYRQISESQLSSESVACIDCEAERATARMPRPCFEATVDGYDWSWAFVIFRETVAFPGYCVGSDGTVWTRKGKGPRTPLRANWRLLNREPGVNGHERVRLCHKGAVVRYLVHRLVLETFIGPCPDGMVACHYPDPSPSNNSVFNLRWATRQDNERDAVEHGTRIMGSHHPQSKLTEVDVLEMRAQYKAGVPSKVLAARYGLNRNTVSGIVFRRMWKQI